MMKILWIRKLHISYSTPDTFHSSSTSLDHIFQVFPIIYLSSAISNFSSKSNFISNYYNHLQILQNKLTRVLLHADIITPIDKMMEDLNWKLDHRWTHQLLIATFKSLKKLLLFIYLLVSLLLTQLMEEIPGVNAEIL